MPIVRSYACPTCFHQMEVTLTMDQADSPPPDCPMCSLQNQMRQEFKPVAIGGSNFSKAAKIAEDIASNDLNVADMKLDGKGGRNKVRYKDQNPDKASSWGIASEALQAAIQGGRSIRQKHGSGLDVLQGALRSGAQPDLIEMSKARMRKEKMILG